MKSLKRTQHQKRQSKRKYQYQLSKQNGGDIEPRVYYVYFNYILDSTPQTRAMNQYPPVTPTQYLTRQINEHEHMILLNYITRGRETLIEEDPTSGLSDLQIISLEQLPQPEHNKYFKLNLLSRFKLSP